MYSELHNLIKSNTKGIFNSKSTDENREVNRQIKTAKTHDRLSMYMQEDQAINSTIYISIKKKERYCL